MFGGQVVPDFTALLNNRVGCAPLCEDDRLVCRLRSGACSVGLLQMYIYDDFYVS